jgi:hypothetical protein
VKPGQVRTQRCDEGGEFGDEVDGLELHVRGAILSRRLELVMHPALRRERQALLRYRRACNVPAQAFELVAFVRLGCHARSIC